MDAVTDIREVRRVTHENLRRQLCLRSFQYATVAEVDESWGCHGHCTASYEGKVRVVRGYRDCPYHGSGGVV